MWGFVNLQVYIRLKTPLLTLMASALPEVSYCVLSHVELLVRRCPGVFDDEFKQFYCRYVSNPAAHFPTPSPPSPPPPTRAHAHPSRLCLRVLLALWLHNGLRLVSSCGCRRAGLAYVVLVGCVCADLMSPRV
jgi:hypothetical protein